MSIVVIGSVFVDIKGYPLGSFIPKGRNAGRVEEVHGGVARNMAEDIGNLGLHPSFIGLVDESGAGLAVVQRLKNHGVDTDYLGCSANGMGTWLAVFDESGDVCASISKRPDLMPIGETLRRHGDDIFKSATGILLEMDLESPLQDIIFHYAEKYSIPVFGAVSNISICLERRKYLRRLSCFVCNIQEAGMLFLENYSNYTIADIQAKVVERVRASGVGGIVVTLGPDGAVYASASGESGHCPPLPTDVVDTTGAGDSFAAGVAVGLSYGKTLRESCEIGTRLASSVIQSPWNVCPRFQPAEFGIEA